MSGPRVVDRVIGGLECMVTGDGPPLVMLPGSAPENCRPVGVMRNGEVQTMRQYSSSFTTYWIGRPTGLRPGVTFAELTDRTVEALRAEFDGPVNVTGNSTGGSLALQLAATHPSLVRRVALISSGSRLAGHAAATQRAMITTAARGKARPLMASFAWDVVPPWCGRSAVAALLWATGPRLYPGGRDVTDMYATMLAEIDFDLRKLPTITAPTLIINGGKDRFYTPDIVQETASLIPGSTLSIYPTRGHVTVASDKDAIRETIAFLSE